MKNSSRPAKKDGGYALAFVMVMLLFIVALHANALSRHLEDMKHARNYYFDAVALDLAESGVNLAAAEIKRGVKVETLDMSLGEFGPYQGRFQTSVRSIDGGAVRIVSTGKLTKETGKGSHSARVEVVGRMSGGKFRVLEFREVAAD